MFFIILVLSIFVFVKTIGYAIYEYVDKKNKANAIIISIIAFAALIFPNLVYYC